MDIDSFKDLQEKWEKWYDRAGYPGYETWRSVELGGMVMTDIGLIEYKVVDGKKIFYR